MDPFSIAVTATGIVKSCVMISASIYTFVDDTRNVDKNVEDLLRELQGLSRVAEAISSSWKQNPNIITAQTGSDKNLWISVGASFEDCKRTLEKLNSKLEELGTKTVFGRGFLRKPAKAVKLNMSMKEISSYKSQFQSYNSAMQSTLMMINVCLLLNNNSSQESVAQVLDGLKTQIGRVETALQGQNISELSTSGLAEDSERMARNLRSLVKEAESFHDSASTVVGDAKTTVWEGSIMGEPLSDDQYGTIQDWISPPIVEEADEYYQSGASFKESAIKGEEKSDEDSDDSDIERHLVKRYRQLAFTSLQRKDYLKAESFYRKFIDMANTKDYSEDEVRDSNVMLAYVCGLQNKWEDAENILVPIAMTKRSRDILLVQGLYAFAMVHFKKSSHETGIKYCKRAVGGYRRILGKSSPEYFESMALLAQICDSMGDSTAAEGCRTFLPARYIYRTELDPHAWLEKVISLYVQHPGNRIRSSTPTSGESANQNTLESAFGNQITTPPTTYLSVQPLAGAVERIKHSTNDSLPVSSISTDDSIAASSSETSGDLYLQRVTSDNSFSSDAAKILQPVAPFLNDHVKPDSGLPLKESATDGSMLSPAVPIFAELPQQIQQLKSDKDQTAPLVTARLSSKRYNQARLIIAVDLGVQDSAVSWVIVGKGSATPRVVSNWPGSNVAKQRVPTVLYYQDHNVVGWGNDTKDALMPTGDLRPGVEKLECFQPFTQPDHHFGPTGSPGLPSSKSEIDMMADYLSMIRQTVNIDVMGCLGSELCESMFRLQSRTHYCFAIPPVLTYEGKVALHAAIIQSGFLKDENDDRLTFIDEPAAIAMWCMYSGLLFLEPIETVLILSCDAENTNLSAYELIFASPCTFIDCLASSGDSIGSMAVRRNFSRILLSKVRKMWLPDRSKTASKVFLRCFMDFENRIKYDFRNNGQKWAIDVGVDTEFRDADIDKEGYMTFTNDEILMCFEPIVARIVDLMRHKIASISVQNKVLKNILVTGIFGMSEYLFQQIKSHSPSYLVSRVVRQVDYSGSAVRGAAVTGVRYSTFVNDTRQYGPPNLHAGDGNRNRFCCS